MSVGRTSSTAAIVVPVRYVTGGQAIQTTSRELGAAGVAVRSLQAPAVGSRVSMALYLPNSRLPEVATGQVTRVGEQGTFWVDFVVLDPLARQRIEELLSDEPDPQTGRKKRAFARHSVDLRVRFRTAREFAVEHASNLSRGGIFIRCEDPPELDSEVEVHLELPDAEIVDSRGIVVHRGIGAGGEKGVGVQFVDAADRFRERIDRYMETLAS